ncbi:uncharacterized protein LOC114524757 [Dendronephthya gigantea]|uniref:uncharacterized protein LOC114524757 n=1 Tax=Dendronephthya gigantea TaxID=151771 RepID=UPI00106D0109|nr:uncharacterized protein LOC114524757 [Dendronephthya gigantea]
MSFSSNQSSRSLVNNYELALLEANHLRQVPTSSKLYKCFEMFDEVIPMLGQYKRVMKIMRDQLYDAVFSRQYTVDIENETLGPSSNKGTTSVAIKNTSIERVPYFEISNKLLDERNHRAEIAEEQVDQLKNIVQELNDEIAAFKKNISDLESAVAKQEDEIQNLRTNLVAEEQENQKLDIELRYQREKMNRREKDFENSVQDLNEQLVQESGKVHELSRFKTCHDNVQSEFRDPTAFLPLPQRGLFSMKEQKLRKDIAEGTTLENQLLFLRNTCIDNYDDFLEEHHIEQNSNSSKRISKSSFNKQPANNNMSTDEERKRRETAFVNMIDDIENELAQNVQHLSILKNDLDKINEVKRQSKHFENMLDDEKSMDDDLALLGIIKDASMNYKFVPQESILSKYAIVVLYSCNQGKTFQELPGVKPCKSCATKTLVCPHRVTNEEKVFHLPLQCTHIKFTRPELQVSHPSKSDFPVSNLSKQGQSNKVYPKIWNDLALREGSNLKRTPRVLKTDFLLSLIEQFYASVVLDDGNGDEVLLPVLQTWYDFLNNRYQSKRVAVVVARDVVETIQSSVPLQPFVQMFAECLCGNLDPATFRYFLLLRRLIQIVQWTSFEDFRAFASIVYQFMDVDDLEQFTMSYRAFSENTIDETLVREFFLSLILKLREPAFHEMENQLLSRPEVSHGVMTDIAFIESIAEISPLSSQRLCQRLYGQSKADTEGNHVSITRLSQIACYIVLHQQAAVMEMEIRTKLQIKKI